MISHRGCIFKRLQDGKGRSGLYHGHIHRLVFLHGGQNDRPERFPRCQQLLVFRSLQLLLVLDWPTTVEAEVTTHEEVCRGGKVAVLGSESLSFLVHAALRQLGQTPVWNRLACLIQQRLAGFSLVPVKIINEFVSKTSCSPNRKKLMCHPLVNVLVEISDFWQKFI